MKKFFALTLITLISLASFAANNDGYNIKVTIKGVKDTNVYLANYFGNKQYYKDTAVADANGVCIFKGDEPLPGGLYSIVVPGKKIVEIIVNEPVIVLETDTNDLVKNMVVKKSNENKLFFEHLMFISSKQKESQPIRAKLAAAKDKDKDALIKKINAIDAQVKAYRLSLMEKHPKSFVTTIFKTMREPEAPSFETEKNDSTVKYLRYMYVKEHYFDDVDFSDERLIRTPLYHNKIEKYFKSLVIPHPDSINKEADYVITKAKANKELFKYTVHYLTNTYEKSKIMGMDAVFVHMALNYYTHDLAYWVDSTQIEKIQERAKKLNPLLIGKQAPNISLLDTSGNAWVNMHKLQAEYTVLIFWDPECGHCKKELPKIVDYYNTIKDKGVVVYSVSSDHNEAWKKFIRENNIDFINVAVPQEVYKDQQKATEYILKGFTDLKSLNYNATYDIFSTPVIYLLDKNKNIIAKRLDSDLLKNVLEREWSK